jgi:hypothetical protein
MLPAGFSSRLRTRNSGASSVSPGSTPRRVLEERHLVANVDEYPRRPDLLNLESSAQGMRIPKRLFLNRTRTRFR